jgi:hypothetical protein
MCDTTLLFHELYLQYIDSISDEFMDEDEIDRLYDEYVRKCSIVAITSRPILPFSSKNLNYASMMLVPIYTYWGPQTDRERERERERERPKSRLP